MLDYVQLSMIAICLAMYPPLLRIKWPTVFAFIMCACIPGAMAYPTDHQHSDSGHDNFGSTKDATMLPFPYLFLLVGVVQLYRTLTARHGHEERLHTALILSAVLALVWCVLRQSVTQTNDILPTVACAWLAAWVNLIGSGARVLKKRKLFVILTVFVGGGVPILTFALLVHFSGHEEGSVGFMMCSVVADAAPVAVTAWTLLVIVVQQVYDW